jgi:hypothetical protein
MILQLLLKVVSSNIHVQIKIVSGAVEIIRTAFQFACICMTTTMPTNILLTSELEIML